MILEKLYIRNFLFWWDSDFGELRVLSNGKENKNHNDRGIIHESDTDSKTNEDISENDIENDTNAEVKKSPDTWRKWHHNDINFKDIKYQYERGFKLPPKLNRDSENGYF